MLKNIPRCVRGIFLLCKSTAKLHASNILRIFAVRCQRMKFYTFSSSANAISEGANIGQSGVSLL